MRFRLLQRRGFWAMSASLLVLCFFANGVLAGFPMGPEPTLPQAAVVDIAMVPSSVTVDVNGTFTLDIYVYPNGQQVDTVEADLTFNSTYLEVQSITGDPEALPDELYSAFDNTNGTLTHSRGIPVGTSPGSDFRLCSIAFKAKAVTDGMTLAFTDLTDAYFGGKSLLGTASGSTVMVVGWQLFLPIILKSAASAPSSSL